MDNLGFVFFVIGFALFGAMIGVVIGMAFHYVMDGWNRR